MTKQFQLGLVMYTHTVEDSQLTEIKISTSDTFVYYRVERADDSLVSRVYKLYCSFACTQTSFQVAI